MNSQCTHWVYCPSPPVLVVNVLFVVQVPFHPIRIATVGMSLGKIVGHPVLGISSRIFIEVGVQVKLWSRMEAMGYERAMDAVLDVAVQMRSIQGAVGEIGSIAELLATQITSLTVFVLGRVTDVSKSEEGGERFDEIN